MYHRAKVIKIEDLTGFRRLYCHTGNNDISFEPGGYIKIIFVGSNERRMRSFSISQVGESSFAIDFVAHGKPGPASIWQQNLLVGDEFDFKGPGPASKISLSSDNFYFYADYTALPALHAHLSTIEKSKNIYIFFEGKHEVLKKYIVDFNYNLITEKDAFLNLLKQPVAKKSSFWAAGERLKILQIRELTKSHKDKYESFYLSSYWQLGEEDEGHRIQKKQDRLIL